MDPVTVRGVAIGAGRPKLAVPLTGADLDTLAAQAGALEELHADVAEWRMDCFSEIDSDEAVAECLRALRRALGNLPLLATFRTDQEGGARRLSPERYVALNEFVLTQGAADLIDVELFSGAETVSRLVSAAHAAGVRVVLSSHDFEKTPPQEELVRRLEMMQEAGADIAKLAVMPRSKADVLTLLAATEEAERTARVPLITMSMGSLGTVSRICGGFFGSALTFGAAEQASAPGQLPAGQLYDLLERLPFS